MTLGKFGKKHSYLNSPHSEELAFYASAVGGKSTRRRKKRR